MTRWYFAFISGMQMCVPYLIPALLSMATLTYDALPSRKSYKILMINTKWQRTINIQVNAYLKISIIKYIRLKKGGMEENSM